MQFSKSLLFSLALVLFNNAYAEGAPNSVFTTSSRCENRQQPYSPLSYVASKAMGALVKCASYACQFLPIPDFIKPSPPTLRMGRTSNLCARDSSDFSSFENYD